MVAEEGTVPCPNCRARVPVPDDWRIVQCPNCGHVIVRMETDPTYD